MGSWGVSLFANDFSRDVKQTFQEIVRLPVSEPEIVDTMLSAFPSGRDPEDEEYTDFWLTLADLCHAYGMRDPKVFDSAAEIIKNGVDLAMKQALGMTEADIRRRERVLRELRGKWLIPAAKPKQRRLMKAPEPFLFNEGDCVVFPTQKGNAAPARMKAADIARVFTPDGWGAFVVLGTAHRYGYWACYLVGLLYSRTRDKPILDTCRNANFSGINAGLPGLPNDVAVKTVNISKTESKKLRLESIGRLELDQQTLRAEFADRYALLDDPYWSISGLLRPYGEDRPLLFSERPVEMKKLPARRFLK